MGGEVLYHLSSCGLRVGRESLEFVAHKVTKFVAQPLYEFNYQTNDDIKFTLCVFAGFTKMHLDVNPVFLAPLALLEIGLINSDWPNRDQNDLPKIQLIRSLSNVNILATTTLLCLGAESVGVINSYNARIAMLGILGTTTMIKAYHFATRGGSEYE